MRSKAKLQTLLNAAGVVVLGWVAAGCATNPATGKQQIMLVSEQQEISLGQQEDQKVVQAMGLYEDPALQQYVEDLGQELAKVSERPNLPWSFKVVDDPVVNAFALPGGYIYITRGILAHMGSEAQLVSVLGHEIGHVTARHSANQISKSQLASIGLGLGMAVAPEIAAAGDLLMAGTGLLFLKFSRDDERQADDLGLRYAERTNYDVREATAMHETLERVSSQSEGGPIPGWASTHPEPENRIDRIESRIALIGQDPAGTQVGKDRFLRAIDGISFGEDPREGFFDGDRYLHPEMAFRFDIPADWLGVNQKQSAGAISPQRDAAIVLTLSKQRDAMQASREFVRSTGVTADNPQRGEFNGLPALWMGFQGRSGQTPVSGRIAFIEHGGRLYEFLGYTASSRWSGYSRAIDRALSSFAPVTDPRVLGVQPARLDIVELSRDMTLSEFDRLYPSSIDLEKLAILNQVGPDAQLTRGDLVKRVVGGPGEMGEQ
jgi:predicted Zn-dependent protease